MGFELGAWYAASLLPRCVEWKAEQKPDQYRIEFTYKLNISADVQVKVTYTVQLQMEACMFITPTKVQQACLTFRFMPCLSKRHRNMATWNGWPWVRKKTYADRAFGARLGIHGSKVADTVAPYLVPQESGNPRRRYASWAKLTDDAGRGFKIEASAAPVELNVSPYTAFELENAACIRTAATVHYTVVTVAGKQMGVGGDDG